MEPHSLAAHTKNLIEEHGAPQVLDVDRSIQVYKPTLTGSESPASYYILPPPGMTADALIAWFEALPEYREYKLTLVSILGIDTFHQPLLSGDDFAKKYFHDNSARVIRVVGKSDAAIDAMNAFIETLKRPFDAAQFPHHDEFSISGYRPPEEGRATVVKLLYKPAIHNQLIQVERHVNIHLYECNLGREIGTQRHATRDQAPELILTSVTNAPAGVAFLDALVKSLPAATPEEIEEATLAGRRGESQVTAAHTHGTRFVQAQATVKVLAPTELKKSVIAVLAEMLKGGKFAGGVEVNITQNGAAIEAKFPRTAGSLWLASSFNETKHIKELADKCILVRSDPVLREGWSAIYKFEGGALSIRALETGAQPPNGWKVVGK